MSGQSIIKAALAERAMAGLAAENEAVPLTNLLKIIDCVLSLSRATCLKEIDVPAMLGEGA